MAYTDVLGLEVTTTSSDALAAWERGVDLFMRWRSGSMEALDAAVADDPAFVMAHCTRAYIALRMAKPDVVAEAHQQIMAVADTIDNEREHLHVQAVDAIQQGERAMAQQLLDQIAARYPTDRLAARISGLNCIVQGNYRGGIDIARRSLDACPNEPQFLTMLGFFLEQSGYNDEGLEVSLRSLAKDPTSLYTYHAVGHAYQARGDYANSLETFERAASLDHYPQVRWHLAESQALLGYERLTREYWATATPPLPHNERVELLWRLEMLCSAESDAAVWQELAAEGERMLEYADFLTLWMHHWIGLTFARAGQMDKARQQIERLRQLPEGRPSGYWSTLGADLLEGELAIIQGDYAKGVEWMTSAVQQIHLMGGGSREQKDIFLDLYLEIQRRLGNADAVTELAQKRLLANPNHIQSWGSLAWAYGKTGQDALQRQAYRQLVTKGEAVGLAPDNPALLEARQALQNTP